ncbi:MAG: ABC transporter permease [Anaerolineales bacterium]|uniref:ABC transporter permease n=1 Tax=Candidatus Desulfolinea nitratireducens TaxID=2841698 RepID=A0A8J6NLS3_9CHLR|nr:ABC transporter permease [Candidatus Desulfolinea nitratireducens]MBL6961341.1 ABC transporter permease [Anaerolineales bacterium]
MTVTTQAVEELSPVKRRTPLADTWENLRRSWGGMIGLTLIVFHVLLALSSPYIVPQDPQLMDAPARNEAPSTEHLFGTDKLGRDMFSRSLVGGRVALVVTMLGTALAMTWGGLTGILLGFLGGKTDEYVMRVVDALLAIPWLLVLLLIISILGTNPWVQTLTFGFTYGYTAIRVARAATLDYVTHEFVLAARARGERKRTIVLKELLPNVLDVLLVDGAMTWSWMLLGFSSLSFLGFGVTPPTPDWGFMIAKNREILAIQPWAVFGPAIMLSTLIIGINLFSDALAKALGLDRSQGAPV